MPDSPITKGLLSGDKDNFFKNLIGKLKKLGNKLLPGEAKALQIREQLSTNYREKKLEELTAEELFQRSYDYTTRSGIDNNALRIMRLAEKKATDSALKKDYKQWADVMEDEIVTLQGEKEKSPLKDHQ